MWIEIYATHRIRPGRNPSQPARAVWIEIVLAAYTAVAIPSQPARAVWIEIVDSTATISMKIVTACEGCVD